MRNDDKLTGLVEQAALVVNILNTADMSGIEELQILVDRIKQVINEAEDLPQELLKPARSKSYDAAEIIEKILRREIENSTQSIELLSRIVVELQGLTVQITQGKKVPDQLPNLQEDVTMSQQEGIIAEDDLPLILDFITEANEHISNGEAGLLELEKDPKDSETLNLIFRAFHTIKGMAGFLNLTDIGSLAHSAENLLDLARKGEMVLSGETVDVIFESMDVLKKMVCDLKISAENSKPLSTSPELQQLLIKLKSIVETPMAAVTVSKTSNDTSIQENKISDNTLISDDEKIEQTINPESDRRDGADRRSGQGRRANEVEEKIKVSTTRLDKLVNMVGELVIAQLMVSEEAKSQTSHTHQLNHKVAHQSKIVRELQELSMSMRMVPIGGVFQKMTRLVRDLSHKAGKNVNLTTSGEDTELDRNIVDKISDPLVHMIRNSIDHGIENKEDRVKAGKSSTGQIKLRAFHQSGNIVIEIEDDGKGLNREQILKKAIANGLAGPDQQLSEQEIYKLIYHAGLSTAEKVTNISGRGVGMDVVRKNIESLRGRIDISSVLGKGTTFTIRLPLTLAIIDGQVIKAGTERYIIPINSIVQSFRPTVGQVSTVQGKGEVVMVRGELIPLIRLHKLFNIETSITDATQALLVIVEEDGRKCCLLVDELLGRQQVVIKSLGESMGKIRGVSGGAIMGDGKISLILDVQGLIVLSQC